MRSFFVKSARRIDFVVVKREIETGEAQMVDIREKDEWTAGYLRCACLLPLSKIVEGDIQPHKGALSTSKRTYIHCAAGGRVAAAKKLLERMGFESVVALREGYADLVRLGFAPD